MEDVDTHAPEVSGGSAGAGLDAEDLDAGPGDDLPEAEIEEEFVPLLFNKWSYSDLTVQDIGLKDYIAISGHSRVLTPHTARAWSRRRFLKASCPLVERLVVALMYHGRNTGKKMLAVRTVQQTFELIHLMTGKNPMQMLIDAVQHAGPREDSCAVGSAGTVRRQSVDVSPYRRVCQAIYLITQGARKAAFRSRRSFAECLAGEIVSAAVNDPQKSSSIARRVEIERTAKSNR